MYWNINKVLSYDKLFNFIVGARGCGKTYGSKKHAINRFLKTGEQFVYVRRYKTELKNIENFFADIIDELPKDMIYFTKNGKFYCQKLEGSKKEVEESKVIMGFYLPLSTALINKSNAYPKVSLIIFDEFVLDRGVYHYLSDEVICFLNFFETINRNRNNTKVLFLSNAISVTNPYFSFFNIKPRESNTFTTKKDMLIQLCNDSDFVSAKKKTRFGKLIEGSQYADFSIENKFLRDNPNWIKKMGENCNQQFEIIWKGKSYGIWNDSITKEKYFSYKHNPNCLHKLAYSLDDHSENTYLIDKNNNTTKNLRTSFNYGMIRFESMQIKNEILPLLERIR